ncbi:MAG: HNH endonuclease signature motif containing protein [Dehalococcoidia bacterium]
MPSAPPKPCRMPGCPTLDCEVHRRKPWTYSAPRRQYAGSGWAWQRLRARIIERDGGICHYCRGGATTVDHVVAVAHGGTDDESDLQRTTTTQAAREGAGGSKS